MLKLSKKADYALIAVRYLATQGAVWAEVQCEPEEG
jgi:hypothetical protein